MQNEITSAMPLLDPLGHITGEGWARHPHWIYERSAVKAPAWRLKEWDYYAVLSADKKFGITLTISDLGYIGLSALCFLDLEKKFVRQVDSMSFFPMGKTNFPADSDSGDVAHFDGKVSIKFETADGKRNLKFSCPGMTDALGNVGLTGEITLLQPKDLESMVIATSWKENRRAFYYNRKVNCMSASGGFTIGERQYSFDPAADFGVLDWGRGNWTYRNRWYWGSASGLVDGVRFGWNIGYGFSDRTPATENVVFFDGRAHKLTDVTFHIDTADYMKPWRFSSSDNRFEMDFEPVVDRYGRTDLLVLKSVQHQVFGYFTGRAILDDGKTVEVKRFPGFAEDVLNWW